MKENAKSNLTLYIFIAIIGAIICALVFPSFAVKLHLGGEIFLRVLKMMVVPLVITSVMSGILGLGDIRKLGRPGLVAVGYYLLTTVVAVLMGIVIVNLIQPGVGTVDPSVMNEIAAQKAAGKSITPSDSDAGIGTILQNLLLMLFTDNIFKAMAETQLLPLIIFSIAFAGLLTTMGPRVSGLRDMIEQINEAFMGFILLIMNTAPLGIFCLVAARFGQAELDGSFGKMIAQTGWYMLTVIVGLGIHVLFVLPLIYRLVTGKNPYVFMREMSQALLTAFSTASSSATLPVTLECATLRAGVSKQSAEFVLPLGATINMDGTALYEAVAAIFIAQALGIDLSIFQQLIIAVTATLAAIGAAGIPEAGLVTMIIVLNAVGLPIEYIGLILSVDWLLDRFRTAVNVAGDSIGAAVVEKTFESAAAPSTLRG